jgi:hypothetical protein
MALRKSFSLLLLVSVLFAPLAAQADSKTEFIDGGTCIPYPPYNQANNTFSGLNYQHWLYGFNGMAFCHLTETLDWPVSTLSYVIFTGWTQSSQVLTAHLCVHGPLDTTVACGASATISGLFQANYVFPPQPLPSANGAFVQFDFPANSVSGVIELIPVWIK